MNTDPTAQSPFHVDRLRLAALFAWTALVLAAAVVECRDNSERMAVDALAMARVCFEENDAFRRWAAGHGGVYVPVTEATPPNPLLDPAEREVRTPSGRLLTLMNPPYMTRQLFEVESISPAAPKLHITSLKPLRRENRPDQWEARVLASFENGEREFGEFQLLYGQSVYRYMRPLLTEKGCLGCHADQGYREGMVRGGISIAIPTAGLEEALFRSNVKDLTSVFAIWLIGAGGILAGFRRIQSAADDITAERDNLKGVFDATPMPMLLFNGQLEVLRVNHAFSEYSAAYDADPHQRCGVLLSCTNAAAKEGCGGTPSCRNCRLMCALREVLCSGVAVRGEASITRARDGRNPEVWLLYAVEAVRFDGSLHALLSFMDISERKLAEERLYRREQEFRALVENSPDPIVRYDRSCRRMYVNPALERLAGRPAPLLIGKTPFEACVATPAEAGQVQQAVQQVLERNEPLVVELSWRDPLGRAHCFQNRFVPEMGAPGTVESVLSVSRDITMLRQTEELLLHSQKMESIGTLAGGIAHDFNNLLSVIGGYAELLHLALKDDEQRLEFVREIADSVQRGAELTRSLLAFSGKREPRKQVEDLNLIVNRLRKSMTRLLRSDITLSFTTSDCPLPVYVDPAQIEQVLINLMVNARDALACGGMIRLTTALKEIGDQPEALGGLAPGRYCVATVADNGIGMSREVLGRIFEPYFTTKASGKGTGLGLAIAFGIVGNHGGRITVDSSPGQGAVFTICLPLSEERVQSLSVPPPVAERPAGEGIVLVVDDEPNVLKVTMNILARHGYMVLAATDGIEALEVFEVHGEAIRAVVVDLVMPRMSGRETIERIRLQNPGLPAILMSGYTDDSVDRTALEALGVTFLSKPVNVALLLDALRRQMEQADGCWAPSS